MSKAIYLLQNENAGYVGNSPCFWHETNSGYTPHVDEAKRFTPQEARDIIRSTKGSHKWKRWHIRDVLKATVCVVDMQKLREATSRKRG